ncbi:MAG: molybdopterin-dependent oxidoreductase [Haloarculaceae archaeon]
MNVTVVGDRRVTLPRTLADCERFSVERRASPLRCHTGRDLGETWRGLPVAELLAAASMPADTTHLLVTGDGDYRMCVDLSDAFEALLAYECDGHPLGEEPGTTRLIGPGIDSTHSVKAVRHIEGIHLDAADDPTDLETYEQTSRA